MQNELRSGAQILGNFLIWKCDALGLSKDVQKQIKHEPRTIDRNVELLGFHKGKHFGQGSLYLRTNQMLSHGRSLSFEND